MSWLSSALTAPGTSAANTNRDRQSGVQKGAVGYFNAFKPSLEGAGAFAGQMEPEWQRAIQNGLNAVSPWGQQTSVDNARQGFLSAGMNQLPLIRAIMARNGAGIGAEQGAQIQAINGANSRANDLQAWYASPEGKQKMAEMAAQLSGMGMNSPILNAMSQLSNIIYGRPAPQVGASPLASIAGIGAQLFSGGAFGGGGGIPGLAALQAFNNNGPKAPGTF